MDASAFDPTVLAKLNSEDLLKALPVVLNALGLDIGALEALIPPAILQELKDSGIFGDDPQEGDDG